MLLPPSPAIQSFFTVLPVDLAMLSLPEEPSALRIMSSQHGP